MSGYEIEYRSETGIYKVILAADSLSLDKAMTYFKKHYGNTGQIVAIKQSPFVRVVDAELAVTK